MRRMQRIVLLATLMAVAPVIAGCADFDLDKLDIFGLNEKKKLPGERKPLFPEGVPGVTQGIPPEFMKGNENQQIGAAVPIEPVNSAPAGEAAKQTAAVAPAQEPKAKPTPKPKAAAKPKAKRVVKRTTTAPEPAAPAQPAAQPAPAQPTQSPAAWPSTGQNSSATTNSNPWPAAPPPGTFTR
jgi:outer membrane biosynthesis protein TonB